MPRKSQFYPEKREELELIFLIDIAFRKWGEALREFTKDASRLLGLRVDKPNFKIHKKKLKHIFESSFKKARRNEWIEKIDSKWKLTGPGISCLRGEDIALESESGQQLLEELRRALDVAPRAGESWTESSRAIVYDIYWFLRDVVDNKRPQYLSDPPDWLRNYDRNYIRLHSSEFNEEDIRQREKKVRRVDMLPLEVKFRWISLVYFWLLRQISSTR